MQHNLGIGVITGYDFFVRHIFYRFCFIELRCTGQPLPSNKVATRSAISGWLERDNSRNNVRP